MGCTLNSLLALHDLVYEFMTRGRDVYFVTLWLEHWCNWRLLLLSFYIPVHCEIRCICIIGRREGGMIDGSLGSCLDD